MKICVCGLGLIGGSLCLALKKAGYTVAGWNRSEKPVKYALENKIIDCAAEDISLYDVVFIALPPQATLDFIENTAFKAGAVVSDICGVKGFLERAVYSKPRAFRYVGCHPMAGKEVSGIENACADLFSHASMIITRCDKTDKSAVEAVKKLTADMDFEYIVECSAAVHDRKIAYTSQLAHIVSNAYVKDKEIEGCLNFTGGSFQDMTRIAGVDENVWAALYLENAVNVTEKISSLISSLTQIKNAVESGDAALLAGILAEGRALFENGKKMRAGGHISVQKLK